MLGSTVFGCRGGGLQVQRGGRECWEAVCHQSHGSQLCVSLFSLPEFFDISNHKCVQAFTFIDLDSCVMVMDYW